jgi:hypothetical protein
MPQCYSLILSLASSQHPTTNMWNLFGLIDHVQTRSLPMVIPLEIHLFWTFAPDEIGKDFIARVVIAINTTETKQSEPILFSSATPYTHLLLRRVTLDRTGECRAHIEWRPIDASEWRREEVFWPFIVSLAAE